MQSSSKIIDESPTKSPRKKRIVTFALRPELIARLDAHARASKVSRNWLIERLCEGWCDDQEERF
jgi:predicted transcriptional regulator